MRRIGLVLLLLASINATEAYPAVSNPYGLDDSFVVWCLLPSKRCPKCRSENSIPADNPRAAKLLSEDSSPKN